MQIDLVNLLSGLAPAKGAGTPAAGTLGEGGGFLAAILEMAGEMGLPPGQLLALTTAPDAKAMLQKLAQLAESRDEASGAAALAQEMAADGILPSLVLEEAAVPPTGPTMPEGEEADGPAASAPRPGELLAGNGIEDPAMESGGDIPLPAPERPMPSDFSASALSPAAASNSLSQALQMAPEPGDGTALPLESLDRRVEASLRPASGLETPVSRPSPPVTPPSPSVPAPPNPSEILAQVGERVRLVLQEGRSEIKMQLEPPDLGSVRVHITTEHGNVTVRMVTEVPAVRDVLENGLTQLRAGLEGNGLDVDGFEVTVSDGNAGDPRGFSGFDQGDGAEGDGRSEEAAETEADTADRSTRPVRTGRSPAGGIDYFA